MGLDRAVRVLPGLWLGWTLCVALLATPAAFAALATPDAGRVAGRMLAQEAYTSLALGILLLVLARLQARRAVAAGNGSQFNLAMGLAIATLFCTIAGYFAVQPFMDAARAGQGSLSFGQLHAISAAFFIAKILLLAVLTWRASFRAAASS